MRHLVILIWGHQFLYAGLCLLAINLAESIVSYCSLPQNVPTCQIGLNEVLYRKRRTRQDKYHLFALCSSKPLQSHQLFLPVPSRFKDFAQIRVDWSITVFLPSKLVYMAF